MVDMVRREHRYTHVISTKVSLGMSTDKGRHPKSALHEANADCRVRNVQSKTTVFSRSPRLGRWYKMVLIENLETLILKALVPSAQKSKSRSPFSPKTSSWDGLITTKV